MKVLYPLQYSGLENPMDCIVHRVTKSRTQLSDFHFTLLDGPQSVFGECISVNNHNKESSDDDNRSKFEKTLYLRRAQPIPNLKEL